MAQIITMPKLGLTMTKGEITKWFKREGDPVSAGEKICEIETEKLTSPVVSDAEGIVLKLLALEGEEREITAPICVVGTAGEQYEESTAVAAEPAAMQTASAMTGGAGERMAAGLVHASSRVFITPIAKRIANENGIDYAGIRGTGENGRIQKADIEKEIDAKLRAGRVFITPVAKRMAEEGGVPISGLSGSGPSGRIQKRDVIEALKKDAASIKPAALRQDRRVSMSGMRRTIAARMLQSKTTIPHVYFKLDADMSQAFDFRKRYAEAVEGEGAKYGVNEIMIKAVAWTLRKVEGANVSVDGSEIVHRGSVNIGMAVNVPGGLLVPVIKNADELSIGEIGRRAKELADKARSGALGPDDTLGGTFTVSNLGGYGIDEFSAVINPPECAILAVGAVKERPWVVNGLITARPIVRLTLSVDHRAIDGALAAEFLAKLRDALEHPYLLFS